MPHQAAHSGAYTSSLHRLLRPLVVAEAPHVAPESQCVGVVSPTRWPQGADGIKLNVKAIVYRLYDFHHPLRTLRPLDAVISFQLFSLFLLFVYIFTYGPLVAPLATFIVSFSRPRDHHGTTLRS